MHNSAKTKAGRDTIRNIKREIIATVVQSERKITQHDLEKSISKKLKTIKQVIKSAVKILIAENELIYTYHFGNTFLEISYNKPIRISKQVVVKPFGISYRPEPADIVIELLPGVAFGTCQHPSTRLGIRGIEFALKNKWFEFENSRALDIGTGTGILLIAAIRFGIKRGEGIDIDVCAIKEANDNIKINGFCGDLKIYKNTAENMGETYSLITANLRYPTITELCLHLKKITTKNSILVVSGLKTNEIEDVVSLYAENCFKCIWIESEKDWSGVVFRRVL